MYIFWASVICQALLWIWGYSCEQVGQNPPSGSLLHKQVFSDVILCFFKFLVPLFQSKKSLQSWLSKVLLVGCFVFQLKSKHRSNANNTSIAAQHSSPVSGVKSSTTHHHAGSKWNEFDLISSARIRYLLPKWHQHSSIHDIHALAWSAFTLNQGGLCDQ